MSPLSVRTPPSQDNVFVINPVNLFCIAVEELKVSKQTRLTLPNKTWRNKAEAPVIDTFDDAELPTHYHSTYLTFIVRDPYCIHAYWEIAPERLENLLVKLAKNQQAYAYVLRLYDVTCIEFDGNNANHYFDVEIDLLSKHHYVDLWCDNVSYCGEIGLLNANGDFVTMARSNFVTTPRASLATDSEILWGELPLNATSQSQMIVQTSSLCPSNNDKADSLIAQTPDGFIQDSENIDGPVSIDWAVESNQWGTMSDESELPATQTLPYRPPMLNVSSNIDEKPSAPQQVKLAFGGSSDIFYSRDINK